MARARSSSKRLGARAAIAAASASAVVLGVFAFLDDGVATAEVDLHDGSVWLTNLNLLTVGHLNVQSQALDAGVRPASANFDILQNGYSVVLVDRSASAIELVDPAFVTLGTGVAVPSGADVVLGGSTVAVADPSDGRVWAMDVSMVPGFDSEAVAPLAALGAGTRVTVGMDGVVYALSGETGDVTTFVLDAAGQITSQTTTGLVPDIEGRLSLTVVGSTPVALDARRGLLYLPGGVVDVPDNGTAVLQQPSAYAPRVAVATATSLILQPISGGDAAVTELGSRGEPAAPVYLSGCTYGAWAGNGIFVRDCVEDDYDLQAPIDGALPTAAFVFRVNRDIVVLNDYLNGPSWLASEGMEKVNNWEDLQPPDQPDRETPDPDPSPADPTLNRDEINTRPVAEDDEFGARPGRTTVLTVTDNDYDLDGDVLTALAIDDSEVPGVLQSIRGGGAFQVVLPESASGSFTFTYRVDDGRGGVDDATVTVSVVPLEENTGPAPIRPSTITAEAGATVAYNVLPDWKDPDGDTLYVASVGTNSWDIIEFDAGGVVSVTINPDHLESRTIPVVVSDGLMSVEGYLRISVAAPATQRPRTNADRVVTTAGRPVIVSPLGNDYSPSGHVLRLTAVSELSGPTIVPDLDAGTFTFSSAQAGTFYVVYRVADESLQSAGLIRIDVLPAADSTSPPIAVTDIGLLRPGESVLVDLIANDTDPGAGVLVVPSVDVPVTSGLSVEVLEHRLVRVTATSTLEAPVTLRYTVSNGTLSSPGDLVIIPVEPSGQVLAPVAEDDEVVIRVGDIARVHVLDNDSHPSGEAFSLVAVEPPTDDPTVATVFIADDLVSIKAGETTGTSRILYVIEDEHGQKAAATITVRVRGLDEDNIAPRPEPVVARVLAGQTVRIPINLDGIDPDGDSVSLVGAASAPEMGRVMQVGEDWIVYEAFSDRFGADSFEYAVRDKRGADSTGTITVGIAPEDRFNHAPLTAPDQVSVRPGHSISVPVLVNDSDPDADAIFIVPNSIVDAGAMAISSTIADDRIVIVAEESGEYSIEYLVSDVYGAVAHGIVQVTCDPDVPPVAPIARDDRPSFDDIEDDGTIVVSVLDNDEDPDGVTSALEVELVGMDPELPSAVVNPDGTVTVTVTDAAQALAYTVTDPDDLTASAYILVPGFGDTRPILLEGVGIEMTQGETKIVDLADYIETDNGNPAIITTVDGVFAAHSDGSDLVVDERTISYTPEPGYYGRDGLTLEVTDGLSVDDPEGTVATLTIPVLIHPAGNVPPTFRNAVLEVEPGGVASELNLALVAADANRGDDALLQFEVVGSVGSNFVVAIDGSTFSAQALAGTATGRTVEVDVSVTDGKSDPVIGTVRLRVVSSTKLLPVANDDVVDDARPGQEVIADVLDNDVNPFAGEEPLTIVDIELELGDGEVGYADEGEALSVIPGADFFGTIQVRYTIEDATGDPDRHADGRLYVYVVAPPGAPTKPEIGAIGDGVVDLEWTAPPSNGAPIDYYIVTSDQGTSTRCASSICTISSLANDVDYRFQVVAYNRAGDSPPSPYSDAVRPDARPDQPDPPVLTFGDGSLAIEWSEPESHGSPVNGYDLEISPAAPDASTTKGGIVGTSYTWSGLENGVAYQVRVRAHNSAPEPSTWSNWSASEVPAGPPFAPDKPTTALLSSVGSTAQMGVYWHAPYSNGDPVSSYTVRVYRGGVLINTLTTPAGSTTATIALGTSETAYTFTVTATNKAGEGSVSPESDARRAVAEPGPPTITNLTTPEPDGTIIVAFTPGPYNGIKPSEVIWKYQLNGVGTWRTLSGDTIPQSVLTMGNSYTVSLRAEATVDGNLYTGATGASAMSARPYLPVPAPTLHAESGAWEAIFTWDTPTTAGRDIAKIEWSLNGASWTNTGSTSGGTRNVPLGYGTSQTFWVRVTDTEGQMATTSRIGRPLGPRVTLRQGPLAVYPNKGCPSAANCHYFDVELEYFRPNTNVSVACQYIQPSTGNFYTWTIPTAYIDSNGHGGFNNKCFIAPNYKVPSFGLPRRAYVLTYDVYDTHGDWT